MEQGSETKIFFFPYFGAPGSKGYEERRLELKELCTGFGHYDLRIFGAQNGRNMYFYPTEKVHRLSTVGPDMKYISTERCTPVIISGSSTLITNILLSGIKFYGFEDKVGSVRHLLEMRYKKLESSLHK